VDAIRIRVRARQLRIVSTVAVAGVLVGVFSTWATYGTVTLNGVEGPNDGWLVVIMAGLALLWARMLVRPSWSGAIGVAGVLGAAAVICWTALEDWSDNRAALEASAGHGLVLVIVASIVLGGVAVVRGVELARGRVRDPSAHPPSEAIEDDGRI
jgi:hypothetical protein